jgi:hypothetical protein
MLENEGTKAKINEMLSRFAKDRTVRERRKKKKRRSRAAYYEEILAGYCLYL